MPDSVDVYADQVGINVGPFGCSINFSVSAPLPPPGGGVLPGQPVATVRMSLEHLKLMAFMLRRQLLQYEREAGIQVPVPARVLNQLQIGREDWQECWGEQ